MAKKRVLVDACVILPATNVGEWNRLCNHFAVETVSRVVEETQRGDMTRRSYIKVDRQHILKTLKMVHEVSEEERGALAEKFLELGLDPIDDGERDLFSHILCKEKLSANVLVVTTADRNAARAACALGWSDSLVSLESLLRECGSPLWQRRALRSLTRGNPRPVASRGHRNLNLPAALGDCDITESNLLGHLDHGFRPYEVIQLLSRER